MKTQWTLTTLLLMAWEFEDEGIAEHNNLAKWLVQDIDAQRTLRRVPPVFG